MPTLVADVIRTNPQIDAQRSQVHVLQARLAAARANALPEINGSAQAQRRRIDVKNGGQGDAEFTSASGTVEGRMLLFDGKQTTNGIRVAQQELASGQASFHATVSDVLLELLVAAADVRRDEQIRRFTEMQSDAIAEQLRAITRKFELGEATQTDQALGRARLASAQTAIVAAGQALATSRSSFTRVTGRPAGAVPDLPGLAPLPASLAAAQTRAVNDNPRVRAARRTAIAARYGAKAAKGSLMPKLDAVAGYEYLTGGVTNLFTGKLPEDRSAAFGGVELNVPIFRPRLYADIRRFGSLHDQRVAELKSAERTATDRMTVAWTQWRAASESIETARIAVAATEQAVHGVQREWQIGNRTLVEVLDAQNELLSARVSLERSTRDEYVARAEVLAASGDLKPAAILRTPYFADSDQRLAAIR